uniref:NADH-ubiquinone oxidoreductase chain 3 n=1 Tax=Gari togata TaxID=2774046 RepID=A0A8K0Z4L0_9BIVA|nr:NADH dehydrogenase subunit 3 [Gari togata]
MFGAGAQHWVLYFFTVLLVGSALLFLGLKLGGQSKGREKNSSFECGFEPMSSARLTFCVEFFVLALIFLVFDMELIMLVVYVSSAGFAKSLVVSGWFFGFVLLLILGLYHEMGEGNFEWK